MKLTLDWLKEYLDTTASLDDVVIKLTAIGLEVEGVEDPAKAFATFKVGHVLEATQHPDADRLRVCKVDIGGKEPLQIVCGAPNARAGIKIAFAPEGAYIPGIDVTLKKATIRGVESNGMMCSERELCLSTEHNGIIELPESAVVGSPLAPALGLDNPMIEINVTPNRGDCAGIYGIARDLAAAGLGTLKKLDATPVKGKFDSAVKVIIEDKKACPLFLGRVIKNVKNGESPKWLQDRLKGIGLRPISTLVDITNYFCIGLNRPLHVYDADKINGNIHVRLSKGGEKLEALNDNSYELKSGMTVICDDKDVLGLGGVVGGTATGCTNETTNVFLECAYFDPIQTATTGRAQQIDSDARYRFERGVDPAFTVDGIELATKMIVDLCGGEVSSVVQDGAVPDIRKTIDFDPNYTKRLGGVDVDAKTQKTILTNLGFDVKEKGNTFSVTSPSWRHDIDGKADFVEEVLRIYGFDNLPETSVTKEGNVTKAALGDEQKFVYTAKRLLAARGLSETVTWSFLDAKHAELFGINKNGKQKDLTLLNPISADLSTLRPSILPNLIKASGRNFDKGFDGACLFEVGPVFHSLELVQGQEIVVTGIRSNAAIEKHWNNAGRNVDVMDAKADVLAILASSGTNIRPQVSTDTPDYYHPGRSGAFVLGKNVVAYFGEIHPAVLVELDVKGPIVAFEVFVRNIPTAKKKKSSARPLLEVSPFQPLSRDFAFIVSVATKADDCLKAILNVDKKLIVDADVFDVYQGKGVEEGHKSLAINVTLQPTEKTLTDEEIESISKKIIDAVSQKTGGKLRA